MKHACVSDTPTNLCGVNSYLPCAAGAFNMDLMLHFSLGADALIQRDLQMRDLKP